MSAQNKGAHIELDLERSEGCAPTFMPQKPLHQKYHKEPSKVTWRSVLIGALLIPPNVYWLTLTEVKYYALDGSSLPLFIEPIFSLFLVTGISLFLGKYNHRLLLTQTELLIIYVMVVSSVTFSGHDMLQNMFGSIAHPFWYATPENEWQELFFRYLPKWLTVSDKKALSGFYQGESSFYSAYNFKIWLIPLLMWGIFVLTLMFMMLCINTLIRKRWTESEKLAYPIIQLPLRLSDSSGSKLFKSKTMWIGFGVAGTIDIINGLSYIFPVVPTIPYIKLFDVSRYFQEKPWNAMGWTPISLYPFAIGLAFFLPLDLSFSCWFFYLARKIEQLIGAAMGFRALPQFPYFPQQAWGAWLTLAGIAIWITRRHLIQVFRKIFGFKTDLDDSNEPLRYRAAFLGIIFCSLILGTFVSFAGMSLLVAALFFGIYFALSLAITRVRAELGTPHEIYFVNPHDIMAACIGTRRFNPSSLTVLALFYWFNRGYRNHPMPNQLEAFKMAESTGISNRGLLVAMLVGIVVGLSSTLWANLDVDYRIGAEIAGGFKDWVGWESFNRLQRWLFSPTSINPIMVSFMGLGSALTVFFMIMRMKFIWWPFHPAGYALAISFAMDYFWFAFFASWLIKYIILKHGGVKMHNNAIPFFLGLILGDYVFGSIWSIIGSLAGIRTYKIFI